MVGVSGSEERRPLWGTLSFILALGIGLSLSAAATARAQATTEAERQARLVAQTRISPLLEPKDLEAPIDGDRALSLGAQIDDTITAVGPIDGVTISRRSGTILYDADRWLIGTHRHT